MVTKKVKKTILTLLVGVLLSMSLFSNAYATSATSSNSGSKGYLFFIADMSGSGVVIAPFSARVNYQITVGSTSTTSSTTINDVKVFAYCDVWTAQNLADIHVTAADKAGLNSGSTTYIGINLAPYSYYADANWFSSVGKGMYDVPQILYNRSLTLTGSGGVYADGADGGGGWSISTITGY